MTANEDDPRVFAAVQEYLADLEARRRPDRAALVARHAAVAAALGPYLDALDLVHAAAPLLGSDAGSSLPPADPPPAEPLGDFRIVREIGRGGMGVVYEAVQLSLGRRVALKVLPFAAALDAKHLQRFKTEAHAAAQLHHTNIVPVYAVGSERGVHYYAMQVIDGRPLDAVIAALRGDRPGATGDTTIDLRAGPTDPAAPGASKTDRGREAYRTAARIAAQVAEALDYAHDAGVVHRDVKPANLLLDARGNVWVTDFGLAQVSADAGLTRTGDVFGTIRYMSPEQASGRRAAVDHRTDVYSLGATLYELITLRPMFPGADRQTLLHQLLTEEPKPPRAVDRGIPADLETIVLKAVAKVPQDRYATAGEMAADLRRFLDERPILARRPSLLDRGRKWLRRHPAYVGAALLLLAFGVVGLAASTAVVMRERDRTERAFVREQQRAAEAEQRFRLARRSADEMIRIADEETGDHPSQQALRRRLLEAALAYYQEFLEQRKDDPNAQADLAATRDRVRTILSDLAVMQGAWQHILLAQPAVHDDLKLTGEQRDRLADVLPQFGGGPRPEPFGDFHKLTAEQRTRRLLDEVKAHEAAIAEVLTPAQLKRLRQVAFQVRGAATFREAEVAAALGLTAEQRDRVRGIELDVFPRPDGPGPPRPPDPPATTARVLELLTPAQRAKWRELTGEPFSGPTPNFFPGSPGRGPKPPRPDDRPRPDRPPPFPE